MNKAKVLYKRLNSISSEDFTALPKNDEKLMKVRSQIMSGEIFVIEGLLGSNHSSNILGEIESGVFQETQHPLMTSGCRDLIYTSDTESSSEAYGARDVSRYMFFWNSENHQIKTVVRPFFEVLASLNSYSTSILDNYPVDGVIPRIHLIHYPIGFGGISPHVDPINVCTINMGIYLTEYGVDYDSGGFHVFNSSGEKVCIDRSVRKGDAVLFYPGIPHCVDTPVIRGGRPSRGRYFLHMNFVESHERVDRHVTTAYNGEYGEV